ncbi:MAG: 50S ribosomal protein L18 [Candidatus Pacearchaeota archaeon]|nr:50S ribosomal protein L18 [Candidatus Pacearchaeota archaeon]
MRIKYKRRRKEKTDYRARLALLKSGLPRLVVRKTNRYIIAHVVKHHGAQDYTIAYCNSKELKKYGWPFSFKNLAASYLTGFLLGKKYSRLEKSEKNLILDIGLQRSTKGSRIYACVLGMIEAGFNVKCNKKMLPEEKRITMEYKNEKIKEIIKRIKDLIEKNA